MSIRKEQQYYFIMGTDTNCGKTHVARLLLDAIQTSKQGTAIALKPVASGCEMMDGQLVNDDALRLVGGDRHQAMKICGWPLAEPIAPHIAAARAGVRLSANDIVAFCRQPIFSPYDIVLVEAAGGVMVPLNDKETWLDVIKLAKAPVIFVVGMRLGCINHALLTMAVFQTHGIDCAGWIANCMDPHMLALEENIQTLCQRLPWPLLRRIPCSPESGSL